MKFKNPLNKKIFTLLTIGLFLRLMLCFFGTLELDFNTFVAWSNILVKGGFENFYKNWSDYLPGYMYVLWGLGKFGALASWMPQQLLFKLPAVLADIVTGFLIYKIVKGFKGEKTALLTSAFYIFNPAVFANSSLWGQVDSLTALFSLLAVYLLTINPYLSAVFLSLGAAIKPQAALSSLVVLFVMVQNKWKIQKIFSYVVLSLAIFLLTFIPFAGKEALLPFVLQRLTASLNQYPYGSVNAFNFWALFGFWQFDGGLFSFTNIGVLVLLIIFLASFIKLKNRQKTTYFFMSVVFLLGFLFQARMHERHLLPALAPLVISSSLVFDLWLPYVVLSLTYLANLAYSYIWISYDFKTIFSFDFIKILIILNLVSFAFVFRVINRSDSQSWLKKLVVRLGRGWRRGFRQKKQLSFKPATLSRRKISFLFGLLVAFLLVSRLAWLDKPSNEYFDEVYHVFTARIILHNDPKAWEWWNPHPEGFAYEWTHPPLAKLAMVLGMGLFGENSFGWRFPGAFLGTGCVVIVYLLAKKLFKDDLLALFSAAIFSLDGLVLVTSRIGMNDTYMLFFSLLSAYLFLSKKDFFSALSFGLAISSKWSAIWLIPILAAIWLRRKNKLNPSLVWFFIIPPLVYLSCYIPMFLTGHNLETFWGMQKQMWWYHTGLKATHPYTSAWWSWPFLLRPVYLYTSEEVGGWVARIYNLGNPVVFWFGLISVIYSFAHAFYLRNKNLALVVFSYLIFFVPWAASPRIMFFYHYLPSLPFLAIATGYTLRKNPRLALFVFTVSGLLYLYFYPHWAGISIPLWLDRSYYWFSSWR